MKSWLKSAFTQWVCRSANLAVLLHSIKERPQPYTRLGSLFYRMKFPFKLFGLLQCSTLEVGISLVEDLDPVTGNLRYK